MQLQWQPPDDVLFVRRVEASRIVVVDRELAASFVLTPDAVIEPWPVADIQALDESAAAPILAAKPEVVLIGTGARHVVAPPPVLALFLTRGVGVEAMDNAACARTFNVLAQEGRRVVAGFILPAQAG